MSLFVTALNPLPPVVLRNPSLSEIGLSLKLMSCNCVLVGRWKAQGGLHEGWWEELWEVVPDQKVPFPGGWYLMRL